MQQWLEACTRGFVITLNVLLVANKILALAVKHRYILPNLKDTDDSFHCFQNVRAALGVFELEMCKKWNYGVHSLSMF